MGKNSVASLHNKAGLQGLRGLLYVALLSSCLAVAVSCGSDDVEPVDQLDLTSRSPELDQIGVDNAIKLGFSLDEQEPGRFGVVQGLRHTAGVPTDEFLFQGVDAQNFETIDVVVWPGPGTHVHLIAMGPDGQVLVDPLLEYDLASLNSSTPDAGSNDGESNDTTADSADVGADTDTPSSGD